MIVRRSSFVLWLLTTEHYMDIANLTLAAAHAMLQSRETTAVELVEAALERIRTYDDLGAFLSVDAEG
ncbi:MAG TPA: hypothetical protein VLA19_25780, partial [Herpetosiphonaceae bacterium]|nr:hypothetical protein [Herpetosiphonaceae bacterium]